MTDISVNNRIIINDSTENPIDIAIENYKIATSKKIKKKEKQSLLKDILITIKEVNDPKEKSERVKQILNMIKNEEINIDKVSQTAIAGIFNAIDVNDIDNLAEFIEYFEFNIKQIKEITDKLNKYIKENKKKDIYKKELVEKVQTKMINSLGDKKHNNFELWNNILRVDNITNPEVMTNFCEKFHGNMVKAKKQDKINVAVSSGIGLLVSAIPILNYIAVPVVLCTAFIPSLSVASNHYDNHPKMFNKMIEILKEIKAKDNNANNISKFQSGLIKMALKIDFAKELDTLMDNISFDSTNIIGDIQSMEEKFHKRRLKELYEKCLGYMNDKPESDIEKYFLKKLENYNNPEIKKSSNDKKEVQALLMAVVNTESYEQLSDEFRTEIDKAMINAVKGKTRFSSGLDKSTYNKAKQTLSHNKGTDSYQPLSTNTEEDIEMTEYNVSTQIEKDPCDNTIYMNEEEDIEIESTSEQTEKDDIVINQENITNGKITLSNLENAQSEDIFTENQLKSRVGKN